MNFYTLLYPLCLAWCPLATGGVTPWTVAHQAPLSMGFSRQEHWSGCHFVLQRIFPAQGSNPHELCFLHWQAGSLPLAPQNITLSL